LERLARDSEARWRPARQRLAARLGQAGIRDPRVLQALESVPRHLLLPEALRAQAYRDAALPIGDGQTISAPSTVAAMTEALELRGDERVLEVGTGSGYQAAVLSQLAAHVVTIERRPSLAARARSALDALGVAPPALFVPQRVFASRKTQGRRDNHRQDAANGRPTGQITHVHGTWVSQEDRGRRRTLKRRRRLNGGPRSPSARTGARADGQ